MGNDGCEGLLTRELFDRLYGELRLLAHRHMRREWSGRTMQTTALVHEAYQRLVVEERLYEDRAAFFRDAARAMRHILVDDARRRKALKRGRGERACALEACEQPGLGRPIIDVVALDEALGRLADLGPRMAAIVELRFFAGLTVEEAAGVLGVSKATVEKDWRFARGWLRAQLNEEDDGGADG